MTKEIVMSNSDTNAIVDESDYLRVSKRTWCLDSYGYVVSIENLGGGKYQKHSLHREVMNAKEGEIIDHADGDKLNNTKDNLRFATVAENTRNSRPSIRNTTGYKGVSKGKGGKYYASISCNGVGEFLGSYSNARDAAKAYNLRAKELFGEFAWLNDVDTTGFVPSEGKRFTSKYKGVSLNKATGRWRARTTEDGKEKHIGTFDSEEEAYNAYIEYINGKEVPEL